METVDNFVITLYAIVPDEILVMCQPKFARAVVGYIYFKLVGSFTGMQSTAASFLFIFSPELLIAAKLYAGLHVLGIIITSSKPCLKFSAFIYEYILILLQLAFCADLSPHPHVIWIFLSVCVYLRF